MGCKISAYILIFVVDPKVFLDLTGLDRALSGEVPEQKDVVIYDCRGARARPENVSLTSGRTRPGCSDCIKE